MVWNNVNDMISAALSLPTKIVQSIFGALVLLFRRLVAVLDNTLSFLVANLPLLDFNNNLSHTPRTGAMPYSSPSISGTPFQNLSSVIWDANSSNSLLSSFSIFAYGAWDFTRAFCNSTFGFGFYHIQGLFMVLAVDAMLTDDEPLWEPIEWSLVQSWILFIFSFAWIAENLIVSRFGSYTGRDNRVWFSWYKSFWLIELWYIISYGAATIFVIVPFYFETSYNLSFVFSWWHWYSRVFFFKFISLFTVVLLIAYLLQMSVRWLNWKNGLVLILLVNMFLGYLLYTHFIMTFFGYFTDPTWYQKTRPVDYVQLSHEPARWGWGGVNNDHFTYHNVRTVFWFNNDGPFAASFLMFHLFMWVCMFLLSIFWIALFSRVYAMNEIPLTYTTYCVSALKQFLYFFLLLYIFVFASYITCYWRFPIEFLWTLDSGSWVSNFNQIVLDYPRFLWDIIFG